MAGGRRLDVSEHAASALFELDEEEQRRALVLIEFLRDAPHPGGSKRAAPFPHPPGRFVLISGRLAIVYRYDDHAVEIITVRRTVPLSGE